MQNWYIIHVVSRKERSVIAQINRYFDKDILTAFIPQREWLFRKQGKAKLETQLLFPGYIFIESCLDNNEFIAIVYPTIMQLDGVIRVLSYGRDGNYTVHQKEQKQLLFLLDENYCVRISSCFIEGDKVYINKGPLAGKESIIRKINRHKYEARIDFEIFGAVREIVVGLEVLQKI